MANLKWYEVPVKRFYEVHFLLTAGGQFCLDICESLVRNQSLYLVKIIAEVVFFVFVDVVYRIWYVPVIADGLPSLVKFHELLKFEVRAAKPAVKPVDGNSFDRETKQEQADSQLV